MREPKRIYYFQIYRLRLMSLMLLARSLRKEHSNPPNEPTIQRSTFQTGATPPSPVQVHKTVRRRNLQSDHRSLAITGEPPSTGAGLDYTKPRRQSKLNRNANSSTSVHSTQILRCAVQTANLIAYIPLPSLLQPISSTIKSHVFLTENEQNHE